MSYPPLAQSNPTSPDTDVDVDTNTDIEKDEMVWLEPPWRVFIHNDNKTTFEFVERIIVTIFKLSREIAEHIAVVTHIHGIALVCVRPRARPRSSSARASSLLAWRASRSC